MSNLIVLIGELEENLGNNFARINDIREGNANNVLRISILHCREKLIVVELRTQIQRCAIGIGNLNARVITVVVNHDLLEGTIVMS